MADYLIIDARHNGPPGSGNGGWTSGLIAAAVAENGFHGVPEVMLRQPPPLDTALTVTVGPYGLNVRDPDGLLIATGSTRTDDIPAVPWVSRDDALEASSRYPGHGSHHFPTCYTCGPLRDDGLRIFPGRLPDGRTAAPFDVPGDVDVPMIWAALDCPGGWTVIEPGQAWVLGRFALVLGGPPHHAGRPGDQPSGQPGLPGELPRPGDKCVVVGQLVRREGRKALVRTTLFGPERTTLARAEATWIALA